MKKVDAYKCEMTGQIFEDPVRAARSEFRSMMKGVGGSLPHMGSVNSTSIMEWLADNIASEVYPTVADKLHAALGYYSEHLRPLKRSSSGIAPPSQEDAA